MTWRTVLIACLALGVALGIRWFIPADRSATPPIAIPDTRFDYTLTDFDALFRDANQQVELTLSGPRLEHISDERVARLVEPVFHIEPQAADWRGRADSGRILRDEEVLILEGHVMFHHRDPDGPIEISAEQLRYDRRARTITSTRPVIVEQAGSLLQSGGLILELDDDMLRLTNGVHGEFDPPAEN